MEAIPAEDRHGKSSGLFFLWFSSNANVMNLATGMIGISLGLSLRDVVIAVVIGNVIGAFFMAYHSAQGPILGLPQMIQSRAQFGFYGSALPNIIVLFVYFGFYVGALVLSSQSMAHLLHIPTPSAIILSSLVTVLVAFVGYRMIHGINRVMAIASAALVVVLVIALLGRLGQGHYKATDHSFGLFLLMTSVAASSQITYAPYVSDYSRYLPASVGVRRPFWFTYLGTTLGGVIFESAGALAGVVALPTASSDTVGYLAGLFPSVRWLITVLLFLGLVATNAQNVYGAYITAMTIVTTAGGRTRAAVSRGLFIVAFAIVGAFVGAAVSSDFLTNLANFITVALYALIPWTAINLTDFYLVKRGRYDVASILSKEGRYGLVNWRAITVYIVTIAIEVPFMNNALYEGPVAKGLQGADIAWIVGLLVGGGLWVAASRRRVPTADLEASVALSGSTVVQSGEVQ
ncbi:purine-cytosine permease family protein [Streptomyces sp. NPDC001393]